LQVILFIVSANGFWKAAGNVLVSWREQKTICAVSFPATTTKIIHVMKNVNLYVLGGLVAAYFERIEFVILFLVLYCITRVDEIKFKA
jgi:hypothetical protein